MYRIEIPVGVGGNPTQEQLAEFCDYFSCRLQKKKKGYPYWTITSEDPLNFFWLGANIGFKHNNNISLSTSSKLLGE